MMTAGLIAAIATLAALDSLNPATMAGVVLILLAPLRRPVTSALAYVAGAYLVVLAAGIALFLGSSELSNTLQDGVAWVRRGALLLAAVILAVSGLRRLRTRTRSAVVLPPWFGPWTAGPLGVVATGADLPNAFPYLLAIERLSAAGVPTGTGVIVLALYALVYCLPCLVLLAVGVAWRGRVTSHLQRVYERLGAERIQPRSVGVAVGLLVLATVVAVVALTL
jgi:hypothetical protein